MEGHALLIGVNQLKKDHYINDLPFDDSLTNISKVGDFLLSTGSFQQSNITKLSGVNSDWDSTTTTELTRLKNLSTAGGEIPFVFIYISCHGAKFQFNDKDYTHKNFLCFYDRMVLENELRQKIEEFKVDFKIHVMIDSCYSEGLDIDYVIEQQIGESTFFRNVFEIHRHVYQQKIDYYPTKVPSYKADTCFMYSVKQDTKGLRGTSLGKPTLFTKYYLDIWKNYIGLQNGIYLNYSDFNNQLLRQFVDDTYSPVVKIYPSPIKSDNFFYRTTPFLFTTPSVALNNPIQLSIKLIETPSAPLIVELEANFPTYIADNTCTIYDLTRNDSSNSSLQFLKTKLEALEWEILKEIEFIAIVRVSLNPLAPVVHPFQKAIESLRCETSTPRDRSNVLVVLIDPENGEKIIGYRRTKGKVSNTIGG